MAVLGMCAVAGDLVLVAAHQYPDSTHGRWVIALVTLAILLRLSSVSEIGLRAPVQGWRPWGKLAAALGAILTAGLAGVLLAERRQGFDFVPKIPPDQLRTYILMGVVVAPLLEESIYRAALCPGVAAAWGPKWAILLSGTSFALLHIIYGNASPQNCLGGFVLAWAFVRSGSLPLAILLHAGGNAINIGLRILKTD